MKKTRMFVTSLAGTSLSTAALLLLIPSLFGSGGQVHAWAAGGLACLAVVFTVGMMCWRPTTSNSNGA